MVPQCICCVLINLEIGLFCRIMVLVSELALYVHVYEKHRIMSLEWSSPWTWLLCFLVVDFIYYWFHRATHGSINFVDFYLLETSNEN